MELKAEILKTQILLILWKDKKLCKSTWNASAVWKLRPVIAEARFSTSAIALSSFPVSQQLSNDLSNVLTQLDNFLQI